MSEQLPLSKSDSVQKVAYKFVNFIFWIPNWIFIILFAIIVLVSINRYLFSLAVIEPYIVPFWAVTFLIKLLKTYGWQKTLIGIILFVGSVSLLRWFYET